MNNPQTILKEVFGHDHFRDRQGEIVERILDGKHCLVIMPTGMGKSVCYQIPAISFAEQKGARLDDSQSNQTPLTLVISPLIALMKDQVDALVAKGVDATFVNSSLTRQERLARYKGVGEGDFDLLYVTPERFRKPDFCEIIARRNVVLLGKRESRRLAPSPPRLAWRARDLRSRSAQTQANRGRPGALR